MRLNRIKHRRSQPQEMFSPLSCGVADNKFKTMSRQSTEGTIQISGSSVLLTKNLWNTPHSTCFNFVSFTTSIKRQLINAPTSCKNPSGMLRYFTIPGEINVPLTLTTAFCRKRFWNHRTIGNPNLTGLALVFVWDVNGDCINIHSGHYLRIGTLGPPIVGFVTPASR